MSLSRHRGLDRQEVIRDASTWAGLKTADCAVGTKFSGIDNSFGRNTGIGTCVSGSSHGEALLPRAQLTSLSCYLKTFGVYLP